MSARIERRQLAKTSWENLARLARWKGYFVLPGPETFFRRMRLVEALVRDLDSGHMADASGYDRPPMRGPGTVRQAGSSPSGQSPSI